MQWLVIRRRHALRCSPWLAANALGFAAGDYANRLLGTPLANWLAHIVHAGHMGDWAYWPSYGFLIGLVVGTLEGLVLRWQLSRAGLWVLANVIGFAAGYGVGIVIGFGTGVRYGANIGELAGYAAGGAVMGAVTGIAFVLLLRRPGWILWTERWGPAIAWRATASLALLVALMESPLCGVQGPLLVGHTRPVPGRIVFLSDCDGSSQFYVINADGSSLARFPRVPDVPKQIAFSPDGRRIAFTSGQNRIGRTDQIYIMGADGSHVTRLTTPPRTNDNPTFSPDGARIAFDSDRDGSTQIYMMNADGSRVVRLTSPPGSSSSPEFSPDGRKMVFDSDRGGSTQIYMMNADGANVVRLTDLRGKTNSLQFNSVSLSPDGRKIAFTSQRDRGLPEIYVMSLDGTNAILLTKTTGGGFEPVFSPDSRQIAFLSWNDGQIHVMNTNGTKDTRLTNLHEVDAPIFNPDGTKIAFTAWSHIYMMNTNGSHLIRLDTPPGNSWSPAFSP
ncbi:MAG TPA: hypothetical protein VKT83_09415 [bacterium]|nr:hypothetical protein [bacterium]